MSEFLDPTSPLYGAPTGPVAPMVMSKEHQVFASHWHNLARGGSLPGRSELNLQEIKLALPSIVLIDVLDKGGDQRRRYKYRLVGSGVVSAFEKELTGLFVDENPYDFCRHSHIALFDRVVEQRAPLFSSTYFCYPSRNHLVASKTVYPLAEDGETVNMIAMVQTLSFSDDRQTTIYDEAEPSSAAEMIYRVVPGQPFRVGEALA